MSRNANIARRLDVSAYTSCLVKTASRGTLLLPPACARSVPNGTSVTERCMQMAGLLKKLRAFADEEDSARIGELLDAVSAISCQRRHLCSALAASTCIAARMR